jgi:hypothetical protein
MARTLSYTGMTFRSAIITNATEQACFGGLSGLTLAEDLPMLAGCPFCAALRRHLP